MIAVQWIDYLGRRAVAWPLALAGWLLTDFAQLLIRLAAWVVDLPIPEREDAI